MKKNIIIRSSSRYRYDKWHPLPCCPPPTSVVCWFLLARSAVSSRSMIERANALAKASSSVCKMGENYYNFKDLCQHIFCIDFQKIVENWTIDRHTGRQPNSRTFPIWLIKKFLEPWWNRQLTMSPWMLWIVWIWLEAGAALMCLGFVTLELLAFRNVNKLVGFLRASAAWAATLLCAWIGPLHSWSVVWRWRKQKFILHVEQWTGINSFFLQPL